MSYIPIIQRTDFTGIVKIGVNVKDSDLEMHIKDAQELDFFEWADDAFYSDVMNISSVNNRAELLELVNTYIKPYLVCGAYYNYLLWAGRDLTQAGIRVHNSESSSEISDKGRGELMADISKKRNVYLSKLKKKLCNDEYTYDGITYTMYDDIGKSYPKSKIGISRIGKKQKYFDKKLNRWL